MTTTTIILDDLTEISLPQAGTIRVLREGAPRSLYPPDLKPGDVLVIRDVLTGPRRRLTDRPNPCDDPL